MKIYGYGLSLCVVEYQTAILRGDLGAAEELLKAVPKGEINKVARFLEGRGVFPRFIFDVYIDNCDTDMKELALQISTDPEHKFDLALLLDDLDTAHSILLSSFSFSSTTTTTTTTTEEITALAQLKWKALGDRALSLWKFDLAKECFIQAGDLSSLLLIVTSMGDRGGVSKVVQHASKYLSIRK